MKTGPLIINRMSKFIGVFIKTFGYIFHFFFKNKRFTIPLYSKPFFSGKQLNIPKIIWQTNYSNRVTLPLYINYLFNRLMSLDWEYRYTSTEGRLEFIRKNADVKLTHAFEQLTDGAAQADFWRIFTLNVYGGVYMDIDAHLVWPLSKIIEPNDKEVFLMTKHNYSNYFIACTNNNPYLQKALELIVDNIEQKNVSGGVYDLTGPTVLNRAIENHTVKSRHNRITCIQGSFTNEHFQYMDKPRGKWTHAKNEELLKS